MVKMIKSGGERKKRPLNNYQKHIQQQRLKGHSFAQAVEAWADTDVGKTASSGFKKLAPKETREEFFARMKAAKRYGPRLKGGGMVRRRKKTEAELNAKGKTRKKSKNGKTYITYLPGRRPSRSKRAKRKALVPAKSKSKSDCRKTMCDRKIRSVKDYRKWAASGGHPDKGGDKAVFQRVSACRSKGSYCKS